MYELKYRNMLVPIYHSYSFAKLQVGIPTKQSDVENSEIFWFHFEAHFFSSGFSSLVICNNKNNNIMSFHCEVFINPFDCFLSVIE